MPKTRSMSVKKMFAVIHGKKIHWRTRKGNIFSALVLADISKGLSIVPMDPTEVCVKEPGNWQIKPSEPGFFFACLDPTGHSTSSTLQEAMKEWATAIYRLPDDGVLDWEGLNFVSHADGFSVNASPCPFFS